MLASVLFRDCHDVATAIGGLPSHVWQTAAVRAAVDKWLASRSVKVEWELVPADRHGGHFRTTWEGPAKRPEFVDWQTPQNHLLQGSPCDVWVMDLRV
jgi:hypothetical protein